MGKRQLILFIACLTILSVGTMVPNAWSVARGGRWKEDGPDKNRPPDPFPYDPENYDPEEEIRWNEQNRVPPEGSFYDPDEENRSAHREWEEERRRREEEEEERFITRPLGPRRGGQILVPMHMETHRGRIGWQ